MVTESSQHAANQFPGATEADKVQIANAMDAVRERSSIVDLVTQGNINPEVVEKSFKLIQGAVKQSTEWTRDMFCLIRACEDIHIAKASFAAAESRAITWFRGMIKESDPEYAGKIKGLNDIAKYSGDKQLTYTVTKSKLLGIIDDVDQLCADLQAWWNFQAKHDGMAHKALPDGYLNIYSKRYADPKKGSTLFMRDAREAQAAEGMLVARKAQLDRELAKKAASETGQNGEQTPQGLASGTRQRDVLADSTQKCLNAVIRAVHDASSDLDQEVINGVLSTAATLLQNLVAEKRRLKAGPAAPAPAETADKVVSAASPTRDMEAVGTGDDGQIAYGPEGELIKPEWLKQEDWDAADEEIRTQMVIDGQEMYELEQQHIERTANEIEDAGSNEPIMSVKQAD